MPVPSIYINLEDDVSKVVARIKKERSSELLLVCPKRCFLFNDSINLRLLKKQVDLLGKKLSIMTMDEKGQTYAKEAGFEIKYLSKPSSARGFSDIAVSKQLVKNTTLLKPSVKTNPNVLSKAIEKTSELFSKSQEEKNQLVEARAQSAKKDYFSEPIATKTERLFPKELEAIHNKKVKQKRQNRFLAIFLSLVLILALCVVFVVLPKAEITVYDKTQNLTRDLIVSVSVAAKDSDTEALIMPGQKVAQGGFIKNSFNTQGKKEIGNKAAGSVVIYNFTGAPINLKAKTTVLVLNNRNYELLADAMLIKPTRYKNSTTKEVDPNSLSAPISVQASSGGEDYNVPAGTRLEVSNQVFGSKPQVLYAKATSAITGGTSRYLSVVSAQDLTSAKDSLLKQLKESVALDFTAKGLKLEEAASQIQDPSWEFDKQEGTESPQFSGRVAGQVNAVAYSPEALKNLVLNRIRKSLSAPDNVQIKFTSDLVIKVKSLDLNNGLLVLDVHFDGIAVAKNKDLQNMKGHLVLKNQADAAEYIKQNAQVDKVEITLVPGWQSWLPLLSSNIKISEKE